MKLEQMKCKPLERAKNIYISKSYIVGCTGQKAVILDRQLQLVYIVDGLDYVYSAQLSPDETKLLLISNGNRFYIVDMLTFEKTRVTVKYPYNDNLDGNGCWSFDGKSVWILAGKSKGSLNSTLRRYELNDLEKYQDYLADKYCLTHILRIDEKKKYFLTGINREENGREYFIHFDGLSFEEYPLDENVGVFSIDIDSTNTIATLYTLNECRKFTLDGKRLGDIQHPNPEVRTLSVSDVFRNILHDDEDKLLKMKELSAELGLETVSTPDFINKYGKSTNGKFYYLASGSGFYLIDVATAKVLARIRVKYGVQNFEEIAPDIIAIATWSGVKFYKIIT